MTQYKLIASDLDGTFLTMLCIAGLSLAVSNAWEEVKKESDRVICSCDGHICQYILEHILKEERS